MPRQRNLSIDLVKIIAMISVVGLHTLYNFFYYCCVIGIPLFFMASGYLQLGRRDITFGYCLRKILRIIRFTAIFILAVWILQSLETLPAVPDFHEPWDLFRLCWIQKGKFYFFWFFTAFIIIYLFLSPLNTLYVRRPKAFIGLSCVFLGVMTFVFIINLIHSRYALPSELDILQPFRVYNWFGYFCLGGLLKRYDFRLPFAWLWAIALFFICYYFQRQFCPLIGTPLAEYFYTSVPIILLSVCVFKSCTNLRITHSEFISQLSSLFLPVYSIHVFIRFRLLVLGCPQGFYNVTLFAATLIVTVALSWILMQIPPVRKLFRL